MAQTASTILVLDADPAMRRAWELADLGPGLILHTCAALADAERLLARLVVDVVVVDRAPAAGDPPGLEVLARCQRRDPDGFRIVSAPAGDNAFAVEAINRGAIDAVLAKPWSAAAAIALVHQGCEAALLRRHNRSLVQELGRRNVELLDLTNRLEELVDERTRDLREAHAELARQQRELVRLETDAALAQLARGLAHELNNPLAIILGYAQRLRRMPVAHEADVDRRLQVIEREVERCAGLVEHLRGLAAPNHEEAVAVLPGEALRQALEQLRHQGRLVPGDCRVEGRPPPVLVGPRALGRVLEEVLENAALNGARHVVLTADNDAPGRLRLVFANDGATPDEAAVRNATRPFFTTLSAQGRRGLGLSLAAALLRDHDGRIALEPRPGGGASATVTLPRARAASHAGAGGAVLVVDDEPLVAELLADALRECGAETRCVSTAAQAVTEIAAGGVAAVFADLNLPDGSGIALVRSAIAHTPGLTGRCALITGGDVAAAAGESGLPVLAKPFHLDQVGTLLGCLLAGGNALKPAPPAPSR